ncbi:MAG: hypothetical protein AMJ54_16140 [Deltaproteobacteria bacterium SG8_13]|nr:MAG: hypothetical protein AMJ54_16140 [Deltaproteobacteria bacterium SG8_13]
MDISQKQPHVYSVSELNARIKSILEERFPFVWVGGEVSNFAVPASGHFYFTLKDETAQVRAVMFKGQNRNLRFELKDGMAVTGIGRVSVYEPRGTYQVIFEHLEPKGTGALQIAFEQLKKRLADEGLFDERHKDPLPFLPAKIHVITSPTGAVVHDILQVVERRFSGMSLSVIPVKVQGDGAIEEIVAALQLLDDCEDAEVAILARGGGSLEDLQAFNSEAVARSIFAAQTPIVSAVGHETDFTIADFVADLRAPTPSAAAELVVPRRQDLIDKTTQYKEDLIYYLNHRIEFMRQRISDLTRRLADPKKKVDDQRLRIDDQIYRLQLAIENDFRRRRQRLILYTDKLLYNNPNICLQNLKRKLDLLQERFTHAVDDQARSRRFRLREVSAVLSGLSPRAVLQRGYSITRTIPTAEIVRASDAVDVGQDVEVLLARGALTCGVKEKREDGQKIL